MPFLDITLHIPVVFMTEWPAVLVWQDELLASVSLLYSHTQSGLWTAQQPGALMTAGRLSKVCPHQVPDSLQHSSVLIIWWEQMSWCVSLISAGRLWIQVHRSQRKHSRSSGPAGFVPVLAAGVRGGLCPEGGALHWCIISWTGFTDVGEKSGMFLWPYNTTTGENRSPKM